MTTNLLTWANQMEKKADSRKEWIADFHSLLSSLPKNNKIVQEFPNTGEFIIQGIQDPAIQSKMMDLVNRQNHLFDIVAGQGKGLRLTAGKDRLEIVNNFMRESKNDQPKALEGMRKFLGKLTGQNVIENSAPNWIKQRAFWQDTAVDAHKKLSEAYKSIDALQGAKKSLAEKLSKAIEEGNLLKMKLGSKEKGIGGILKKKKALMQSLGAAEKGLANSLKSNKALQEALNLAKTRGKWGALGALGVGLLGGGLGAWGLSRGSEN